MSSGTAFIADAMLGRLARWLRLAGRDVLYDPHTDDSELVRLSRQSGRVLLTRDRQLALRRVRATLIESDRVEEQLRQVLSLYPTEAVGTPRCANCNGELEAVGRPDAEGDVPAYVWANHAEYQRCRACGRVYWRGTHWQRIVDTLDAVLATGGGAA